MSTSRKQVREALAALFQVGVTDAQAVYSYQAASFDGQSPVIALASGGTNRQPITMRGSQATYTIDAHVFVLHRADGWTEEDAENQLDAIEAAIGATIDGSRATAAWQRITYSGMSDANTPVPIDGHIYLHEIISFEVQPT